MKKRLIILIAAGLILFPAFLCAQTSPAVAVAAELEALLEAQTVTCEQAARFVLAAAGRDASAAFNEAAAKGWLKSVSPDDAITLGKLSYLIMGAFDMKGGLMYRIAPGPRYAFRSMVSRSYIQGASDPAMKVSGERFLLILGRVLDEHGGEI